MSKRLLVETLFDQDSLVELRLQEWDRLLPAARQVGVLGRLYAFLERQGLLERIPDPVRPNLEAGAVIAQTHERTILWEVNRLEQALASLPGPVVLLKGAAYRLAGLDFARYRLVADVDIMVPKAQLEAAENALLEHGWEMTKTDAYDQQYYRRWMHELPPFRHRMRGTELDVHHTILPLTSRLRPDPVKLFAAARPLPDSPFYVLAPSDMVLHCAAHAFHNGELNNSLRDLLDMHELLCHFADEPDFRARLPQRAFELDLARPLFYAVRYCQRYLRTPLPSSILQALAPAAPPLPILRLMDKLLDATVYAQPPYPSGTRLALGLLYIRSHWLRMPPLLLARHLSYKLYRRLRS